MNVVLIAVKWQFVLAHLTYIAAFLRTPEAHFEHVRQVRTLFLDAGATIKQQSASFLQIILNIYDMSYDPDCLKLRHLQQTRYVN